jgi:RHS repeat-associated protein
MGNTRVVILKGSSGLAEVIQERYYYPFGMLERSGNPALAGEMSELSYGTGSNRYLYNSKEIQNDFDLYWYDYGARFYDPELGRWHSVDPLASDFPSWTPYHYVHNNPILLVDPLGMNADWFQNELTGDIYYNSKMRKGDEGTGAMTGKGWAHMGENGMFGTNDITVIETNKNLATGFKTTGPDFTTEAFFEEGNGQKLMKGQGYELLPTQQIRFNDSFTMHIPAGQGGYDIKTTMGQSIYITEKSAYFPTGSIEKGTKGLNDVMFGLEGLNFQTVNRFQIDYTNNAFIKKATKLLSSLDRTLNPDTRSLEIYSRWSKYPGNNRLINDFIYEYGK